MVHYPVRSDLLAPSLFCFWLKIRLRARYQQVLFDKRMFAHSLSEKFASFSRSVPPCEIYVEVGLLKKIDWLMLDENTFSGALPSELGFLSTMEILYTSRNSLNSTIPSELGLCSNLTELQMQDYRSPPLGGLWGKIPTELGLLTKLRKLRLYRNVR